MIFLESLINGKQNEKISESDLSFANDLLLKQVLSVHGRAKRSTGTNDVKGGTQAKWPKSFSVIYMQELSKPSAQCKLFKGYPSSFILLQIVL